MKILSIDTSSKICGVAVLEGEKLLKEISQDNGLTHSETLMPNIQKLLAELKITLKDIDLIVCDKGPGSFTGIRIGVATAKGFTDSLGINSMGISSLEVLAYNVKENGIICSLIDAKNSNAYWALFEKIDGTYLLKHKFSADRLNVILDELSKIQKPITFVGDGAIKYKEDILTQVVQSKFIAENDVSPYNLGLAGLIHFNNNDNQDLLPLYLRKPQAERMLEEKINGK